MGAEARPDTPMPGRSLSQRCQTPGQWQRARLLTPEMTLDMCPQDYMGFKRPKGKVVFPSRPPRQRAMKYTVLASCPSELASSKVPPSPSPSFSSRAKTRLQACSKLRLIACLLGFMFGLLVYTSSAAEASLQKFASLILILNPAR